MATKKNHPLRVKFMEYWKGHPNYNAAVHVMLGLGIGILYSTYSQVGYIDTVGWVMVFVGVLGHLYAMSV